MSAKVLVGLTLCAAVVACKPKASGGGAASVKEGDATAAPLDPQSQKVIDFVAELGGVDNFERVPAMKKLRAMTAEQLDEVFEDSETPGAVRGCVVGTHVVPS